MNDDLISRQAVLDIINFEDKWLLDAKGHNADTEIAFSGMKSRIAELPSVNQQETKTDVLDKIRAEIKALSNANPSYWHSGDMVEREEVFEIIDKYRAESEDKV